MQTSSAILGDHKLLKERNHALYVCTSDALNHRNRLMDKRHRDRRCAHDVLKCGQSLNDSAVVVTIMRLCATCDCADFAF